MESEHSEENNVDDFAYDPDEDSTPEIVDSPSSNGTGPGENIVDRIPLIPEGFTDMDEALQNFVTVFESRYGPNHPHFVYANLADAICAAFDPPSRDLADRRPLAIYVHNDNALAAHIFPQTVICSEAISSLLQKQFITWAWDVTFPPNKEKLFQWLASQPSGGSSMLESLKALTPNKFPLLIIALKERGQINPVSILYGTESVAHVFERLLYVLDLFQGIQTRDADDERQRIEREQFRQEQADEYERSLAADRRKKQELVEQQIRERAEQTADDERFARTLQRKLSIERLRDKWRKLLPTEPESGEPKLVCVQFRFPNGTRMNRRFRHTDNMENLFTAVFTHPDCPEDITLMSGYPQRPMANCVPEWYRKEFCESTSSSNSLCTTAVDTGCGPSSAKAAPTNHGDVENVTKNARKSKSTTKKRTSKSAGDADALGEPGPSVVVTAAGPSSSSYSSVGGGGGTAGTSNQTVGTVQDSPPQMMTFADAGLINNFSVIVRDNSS